MTNILYSGIDVSEWQGVIKWNVAKNHVKFVILRAGFGRLAVQKDKQFEANYTACQTYNIPVGIYWYNYAKTVDDAVAEAKACLEVLNGRKLQMPIFYDIEEGSVLNLGKDTVSQIAEAFLSEISKAGYTCGIYSMASALNSRFSSDVLNKYDVWVAHVDTTKPAYDKNIAMWQYTWKQHIPGISSKVDADYCYKDYLTKKEEVSLSTTAPKTEPVAKPAQAKPQEQVKQSTITYTVQKGDTLTTIAKKYNTTVSKIAADNNIKNVNLIYVGQKLTIGGKVEAAEDSAPAPAKTSTVHTYIVQRGDTLTAIARKYGTTVNKLVQDNKIKNPNLIQIGQKLIIK